MKRYYASFYNSLGQIIGLEILAESEYEANARAEQQALLLDWDGEDMEVEEL